MSEQINASTSFATKYRPKTLKDLVGQSLLKSQIAGMLKSKKFPRALLLTGPSGYGKTTTARIIARHINKTLEADEKNDIFEYNIGTCGTADEIRALVNRLKYMPRNPEHKSIYILDEVHRLTKTSASALLKEIEEPPAHVIFILCTNEPENLLDTIKGRCEKLTLKAYTSEEILELLKKVCEQEELEVQDEILEKIARNSGNQPRESLAMLQGIANIIHGGKNLSEEQIDKEISAAVNNSIFEISNIFLKALYVKKYAACVRSIDMAAENAESLLNITMATNCSLIKYFASMGENSKYKPVLPYPHLKFKDELSKLYTVSYEEAVSTSSAIQQLLQKCQRESRLGSSAQSTLLANVGEYCYGNSMDRLANAINNLLAKKNS